VRFDNPAITYLVTLGAASFLVANNGNLHFIGHASIFPSFVNPI